MAYCIAVRWTITPGAEAEVRALAESMLAPSNAEPGCQAYVLHVDPAEPSALFLYEQYDDEAAFDAHCASPHFVATVAGRIFPLLADRRLEIYESV